MLENCQTSENRVWPTILCSLEIDRLGQIKLFDNYTGPQVKILVNNLDQFFVGLVRSAISINLLDC